VKIANILIIMFPGFTIGRNWRSHILLNRWQIQSVDATLVRKVVDAVQMGKPVPGCDWKRAQIEMDAA
jgi:hypothetical protein